MKYCTASLILLAVVIGGCNDAKITSVTDPGESALDVWMAGATDDAAIRNSIIRQSTLFPYQFEQNSEKLNSLGARDTVILATHFKSYPGKLNLRRGAESQELYSQRVKYVVDRLGDAGVDVDKISVKNLPAGGDGIPSELVIMILEAKAEQYGQETTKRTSTTGSSNYTGGM